MHLGNFLFIGINLFQSPTTLNMGVVQEKLSLVTMGTYAKCNLPDDYTIHLSIPELHKAINITKGKLAQAKLKEKQWLDQAIILLEKEQVEEGDIIAWSAYHASQENISDCAQPALTQFLQLFYEKAATAAMTKHGTNVLKKVTQFLNPGQVSVIALDAPLYAMELSRKQQESATRVDVVWDTYITSSIKESTRDKRGKRKQREVAGKKTTQ